MFLYECHPLTIPCLRVYQFLFSSFSQLPASNPIKGVQSYKTNWAITHSSELHTLLALFTSQVNISPRLFTYMKTNSLSFSLFLSASVTNTSPSTQSFVFGLSLYTFLSGFCPAVFQGYTTIHIYPILPPVSSTFFSL